MLLQEEVLKRREEGLKRKDIELQESLIRFSKFLQESDSKRSRALKKASDERKACEEKEKEVDQLVRHSRLFFRQLSMDKLLTGCRLSLLV